MSKLAFVRDEWVEENGDTIVRSRLGETRSFQYRIPANGNASKEAKEDYYTYLEGKLRLAATIAGEL